MKDNLEYSEWVDFIKIKLDENSIELKIDFDKFDDVSIFIIWFSYIKFRYFIVEKILLTCRSSNDAFFRNVSFIQKFSYIEFKIWWNRSQNVNYSVIDTKIYTAYDMETCSIIIFIDPLSMKYCRENFQNFQNFYPKMPIKNSKALKEIFGEFGSDLFREFEENVKK